MCLQEKERSIQELGESAHMVTHETDRKQGLKKKGKSKSTTHSRDKMMSKCYFYKKKGHMWNDCLNKVWLEKKGNLTSLVCYESKMLDVSHNTWWIDFGTTIMFQIP